MQPSGTYGTYVQPSGTYAHNCTSTFVKGSQKQLPNAAAKQILYVSSQVISVISNIQKLNDNYFIDCVIRGIAFRNYVYLGCSAVAIRAADAIKL